MHAALPSVEASANLKARLVELWERTGDQALQRLAEGLPPRDGVAFATEQERSDWLSTCLMETFKNTGDATVFALLFERNYPVFMIAVQGHLRRTYCHVDPHDVLQEVFLNIYRYPHKFHSDRADAFRNWGHRIVRNTLLKSLRGEGRLARLATLDEEQQYEDEHALAPDRVASEGERAAVVDRAYLIYLSLYLMHFERLSDKERRALTMVEVEERSYRDVAAALGIRVENLKMVVFRGRRKIFRGMERSLEQLRVGGAVAATPRARAARPPARAVPRAAASLRAADA